MDLVWFWPSLWEIFLHADVLVFQRMATHMIQKDPSGRLSANDYLTNERGKAFPSYFYNFMLNYMREFAAEPTMTSDRRIEK